MLDVLQFAQFARPSAIEELTSSMRWDRLVIGEQRNLLEPFFWGIGFTDRVAQGGERLLERPARLCPFDPTRPEPDRVMIRPPPLLSFAGSPGDAIVDRIFRAGDPESRATETREKILEGRHHW